MEQPDEIEAPDKDCVIGALNLLSGLTQGMGSHVEERIVPSKMMQLRHQIMQDLMPEVGQASFSLLGSLDKACFHHVLPYLRKYPAFLLSILYY